jgi:hypothetical protein
MSEIPQNIESTRENSVELSSLSFNFASDEKIGQYFEKKLSETGTLEKWHEKNQEKLEKAKPQILKAVEEGMIPDDRPETLYNFQLRKLREGETTTIKIKNELEARSEEIRQEVANRLSKFLPVWRPTEGSAKFKMDENANFKISGKTITADLGRLIFEKDYFERVVSGITHETFHLWMSEGKEDKKRSQLSLTELKEHIIFRTIDEGLAVIVSEESLRQFHEERGRNYSDYIQESFTTFNAFIAMKDRQELEKVENQEFRNMGHFYVVGHEVAKTVLERQGMEEFRKLIIKTKEDPNVFFAEYKKLCENDSSLPKIETK